MKRPPLSACLAVALFHSMVQAAPAAQAGVAATCVSRPDTAGWIEHALNGWRIVRRDALHLHTEAKPSIILFDGSCVWSGTVSEPFSGAPHDGRMTLPDGTVIDATLTSFAGTYGADDRPFMVMALPEIWRRDPRHAKTPDLDRLIRSVFVHEMTHTEQAHSTGVWLRSVEARYKLPADLSDDIIQDRFSSTPWFREAYEAERDLLYEAAAERDAGRRRMLAARALDAMEARRSRYFAGADAIYAELEDLFLNMEGAGNWAAYRLAAGEMQAPGAAVDFIRGGRRRWSQDEGLALFLVIDAMLPDWQSRAFASTPASVVDLLRQAVGRAAK